MNDNFTSPDFYQIDDLLSEEHKLIRESTRQWVSKSVCPIIEDYAQKIKRKSRKNTPIYAPFISSIYE